MVDYNIEVNRDIEYLCYSNNDMFLVLVLSNMRLYDNDLHLKWESELSANSKTSLIFNLDNADKSIGKVGEMDRIKDICYKKCIDKINLAIQSNRDLNERILHAHDIPILHYEDFHFLPLTRTIRFHWKRDTNEQYHANIYVEDKKDTTKMFLMDGSSELHSACDDEDIIRQVYAMFAEKRFNNKKWNNKEIRSKFFYPIIEQMY